MTSCHKSACARVLAPKQCEPTACTYLYPLGIKLQSASVLLRTGALNPAKKARAQCRNRHLIMYIIMCIIMCIIMYIIMHTIMHIIMYMCTNHLKVKSERPGSHIIVNRHSGSQGSPSCYACRTSAKEAPNFPVCHIYAAQPCSLLPSSLSIFALQA